MTAAATALPVQPAPGVLAAASALFEQHSNPRPLDGLSKLVVEYLTTDSGRKTPEHSQEPEKLGLVGVRKCPHGVYLPNWVKGDRSPYCSGCVPLGDSRPSDMRGDEESEHLAVFQYIRNICLKAVSKFWAKRRKPELFLPGRDEGERRRNRKEFCEVWLLKRLAPYQRLSNEEIRQQAAAGRFKHIADDFCLALINERERLAAQKLNEPPRFLELVSSRESGSRRRAPLTKSGLDPKESAESEESEEYNARAGAGQKPRSSVVVCPDSSLTCGSHEPIRRELRELTKAFLYLQGDDLQEKLGSQLYSTLRAVLRVYIEGVELDRGTDVAAVMKELDVSKRRAQEIIADLRRRMRALLSDKLRGETARRLLHLFGSSRNNFVLDRVF